MSDTALIHGQDHVRAQAVGRELSKIKAAVHRLRDAITDIDKPIDMRDASMLGAMRCAAFMIEHNVETIDINLGALKVASLGPNT